MSIGKQEQPIICTEPEAKTSAFVLGAQAFDAYCLRTNLSLIHLADLLGRFEIRKMKNAFHCKDLMLMLSAYSLIPEQNTENYFEIALGFMARAWSTWYRHQATPLSVLEKALCDSDRAGAIRLCGKTSIVIPITAKSVR